MLPNYVCKEDFAKRFPKVYYGEIDTPLAIIRVNKSWCQFIQIFRKHFFPYHHYDKPLDKIYLPREDQLKSVTELFKEYCAENAILFTDYY